MVDGSLLYKKGHLFVLFSLPNKNGSGLRRIIVFFFIWAIDKKDVLAMLGRIPAIVRCESPRCGLFTTEMTDYDA